MSEVTSKTTKHFIRKLHNYSSLVTALIIFGFFVEFTFAAETNNILTCNWSSDLQKKEPTQKPYAHVFEKNSNTLILVAAHHENLYSSTTFSLIRKIFSQNRIHFSIVEAGILPFEAGIDNKEFIDQSQPENDSYPTGEGGYTALMTLKNGGHFQGGEPTDVLIKNGLSQLGFNSFDVLGFYIVRNLVLTDNCDSANIERKLSYFSTQLKISSNWRFSEFSEWYLQTNKKKFECPLQNNEASPFLNQYGTQRISTNLTNFRDNYISSSIHNTLENNMTSLVVYGAGHAAPQRCYLESDGWHFKETIFP